MKNKQLSSLPPGSGKEAESKLTTSMQFIKGVGPRRAALFSRIGVETVSDALYYFPRRYDDRRSIQKIGRVTIGRKETVLGKVTKSGVHYTPRRRDRIYEVQLTDGTRSLTGVWFHFREPYMRSCFTSGRQFIFHGEVRWDGLKMVIYHPEVEEMVSKSDESLHFGRIVPIYPLTEELGQRQMRKIMNEVVKGYARLIEDRMPSYLQKKYHLPSLIDSIINIHFPGSFADVAQLNELKSPWHKRLIFEEFFFLELWLMANRAEREKARSPYKLIDKKEFLKIFLKGLPFQLTGAQWQAFDDIKKDMLSPRPMYRLLQGDVGCGKTVVTAIAILLAADNGLQSAVMAPTEILARQHFQTMKKLFRSLPIEVVLLVSGLPARKKNEVKKSIADGKAKVIVGTHALVQEGVDFAGLGLAVIDEQHRFGVSHRLMLRSKGDNPDMLVVTATPIPRTLAMTLYGDMDVSVIDEMPPGRQPVETHLIEEKERDLLYRLVREEIDKGRQAFIIYPLIEESENLELKAAKKMATYLEERIFKNYQIGMIHGRMKAENKKAVMEQFKNGEIQLLVSTTVVEVGVDIPEATVMVVEHAERFGLAQLHQLRGRVGRSVHKAICLLVVSEGVSEEARGRLEILVKTSDGFRLAEEDLMERGPGELAGLRQSGAPDFLLANIIRHGRALEYARKEAQAVTSGKVPDIDKYELTKLLQLVKIKWSERAEYLSSG